MTQHFIFDISVLSAVCLQYPKFIAMKKIRPFFKSAHWADSENAQIFLKWLFFDEIFPRKAIYSHATSQFFVEKSCFDIHMILLEFEKNWFIHFKNSICDYWTSKIANLIPYEADNSKIIITCIKNCHHYMNHHWWNVQIWFSTLSFSRGHYSLRRSRIFVADF